MAEFVVEIRVRSSPRSYSFAPSRVRDVQNAGRYSDRNGGKKIRDAVGAGTGNTHAVAHFFHSRACGEVRKIRVAIAEAHAAFTVGGEHQSETDGRHQD